MANLDRPSGFLATPVMRQRPKKVLVGYGTAIYPGDVVKTETAGGLQIAEATSVYILGASQDFSAASTATTTSVTDHPFQEYIAQDNGATTPTQAAGPFSNCDHLPTAGDATLKQSKMELNNTTVADTVAGFHLQEFVEGPDLSIGVNALWRCMVHEHMFTTAKTTTA